MGFSRIAGVASLGLAFFLAGCASSRDHRTVATEDQYRHTALLRVKSRTCVEKGFLSPEHAYAAYMSALDGLSLYIYSPSYLQYTITQIGSVPEPAKPECAAIAIRAAAYQEKKRRTELAEAVEAVNTKAAAPRQTTCSTYFGQTHCTSY